MIVSDNGTELTSHGILGWQEDRSVEWLDIATGKPQQNGFVESLNGRLRDKGPERKSVRSLPAAQTIIEARRVDDNTCRPHTSFGGLTPNPESLQNMAQAGQKSEQILIMNGRSQRHNITNQWQLSAAPWF